MFGARGRSVGRGDMKTYAKLMAVLALVTVGAVSNAFTIDDAKIMIDRALNSPTLTIKYKGAAAAMVEMKLNGISVGTRTLDTAKTSGESNFTIDLSTLMEGDNEVEIRLYDKDGKVVGTEKSVISASESPKGPIYLISPKVGSTAEGAMDVKVGFGRNLNNKYVSFFVDKQFKAMTNTAPFTFTWDTMKEVNGWHEIEAWVVDDQGNTFKTRSTKVFVNNPGGRTNRPVATPAAPKIDLTPTVNVPNVKMGTGSAGMRNVPAGTSAAMGAASAITPSVTPRAAAAPVNPPVAQGSTLKPSVGGTGTQMGPRTMTPSTPLVGSHPALPANPKGNAKPVIQVNTSAAPSTTVNTTGARAAAGTIAIGYGTRLPNNAKLNVSLYGQPVKFDVAPRVQDGIPITPFRHLFEADGGEVNWDNLAKAVSAIKDGTEITIKIGDRMARVNKIDVSMEMAAFLERGRTMVPLSFIKDSLNVEIEYDQSTGHVLIRKAKN